MNRCGYELDQEFRPGISNREYSRPNGQNTDIEFFSELPPRRFKMGFARFHFAARKLPQAAVTLVFCSLADEVIAFPFYNGCQHASKSHSSRRR